MTIDKLSGINPLKNINKTNRTTAKVNADQSDSVQISSDAKAMQELYHIAEQVKLAPDIRQGRVDEVMEKMKDPNYISSEKIAEVAGKLTGIYNL